MKRILLSLAVCLISLAGYAQSNETMKEASATIILKNKTFIEAYDMEENAFGVKYKATPDAEFTDSIPLKSINMVLHNDGSIQKAKDFPKPAFTPGWEGHAEVSIGLFFDCEPSLGPGLSVDFGYRAARAFYIGLGLGIHEYSTFYNPYAYDHIPTWEGIKITESYLSVPLYLKMNIYLPSKRPRFEPYFDLAIGADFQYPEYWIPPFGVYTRVGFGFNINKRHSIAFGYNLELFHGAYVSYAYTFNKKK